MGNYANSSLEERIARRKKRQRAKRRKQFILILIILALLAGIVYGAISIFSGDNTDDPIEVIEQEETPEVETPEEPEEKPDVPAEPEEQPEAPAEEPEENPEDEPAEEPVATVSGGNNPISLNPLKGVTLLSESAVGAVCPVISDFYNMARAKLLKPEVDPDKPMVALTFDDGPSGKYGNRILDALEKNGARATYFVLGELIEGNSAILQRAVKLGCEIGNHSYDHPTLTKLSAEDIKSQISRTSELVKKATGNPTALVRTPGGAVNATVKSSVGAPIISWSLDTVDWKSRNRDAIVKIVLDNVRDGDIILMHEIYKTSAEAAEIIIPELIKRGYQIVTVSEMMEAREVELTPGKVYFSAYPKKKAETKTE